MAGLAWTRGVRRRLALGLPTVLGVACRGFFIPYRQAATVRRPVYPAIERLLHAREGVFREGLAVIEDYADGLRAIGGDEAPQPRWDQDWFPRLDAAVAYAIVRRMRPRRLVEIGAGHSTRFFARAAVDEGLDLRITAIDPEPRATIAGLPLHFHQSTVGDAGYEPFEYLQAGDVISVDSSHILMPGTDVDFLFNIVLPALPAGVLVHVHDVFLPDDYPREWTWRGYNEQLAVASLLQASGWQVLWASRYVATRMPDAVRRSVVASVPLRKGAFESSLWLEKA